MIWEYWAVTIIWNLDLALFQPRLGGTLVDNTVTTTRQSINKENLARTDLFVKFSLQSNNSKAEIFILHDTELTAYGLWLAFHAVAALQTNFRENWDALLPIYP